VGRGAGPPERARLRPLAQHRPVLRPHLSSIRPAVGAIALSFRHG
jgi:hypothetical protein